MQDPVTPRNLVVAYYLVCLPCPLSHRFPPDAAAMIATLVERDLPFYDPAIAEPTVAALNAFAQALGLLTAPVPYEQVVATPFRPLWHGEP